MLPLLVELEEMKRDALHRLSQAWTGFADGPAPRRIEVMRAPRHDGKSVVFNLGNVGEQSKGVVAKELSAESASVELSIYRAVLPRLELRGPELIGCFESTERGRVWLFLEEIDGPPYEKRDPGHVAIASQWLAAFHFGTAGRDFDHLLSERGPEHYTTLAVTTLAELDEVSGNPLLESSHLEVLSRLSGHLSRFLASSDSFGDVYRSLPSGIAHGDFKGNNMAFSSRVGLRELRVFDWSEAHRGPLAIDTWWVDANEYRGAMEARGATFGRGGVETWRRLSAVLRWIAAAGWEIPRLQFQWVDRPMRRMSLYERRLRSALEASPWVD